MINIKGGIERDEREQTQEREQREERQERQERKKHPINFRNMPGSTAIWVSLRGIPGSLWVRWYSGHSGGNLG